MEGWNLQWDCFRFFWGQMFGLVEGALIIPLSKFCRRETLLLCGVGFFFLFASVLRVN